MSFDKPFNWKLKAHTELKLEKNIHVRVDFSLAIWAKATSTQSSSSVSRNKRKSEGKGANHENDEEHEEHEHGLRRSGTPGVLDRPLNCRLNYPPLAKSGVLHAGRTPTRLLHYRNQIYPSYATPLINDSNRE